MARPGLAYVLLADRDSALMTGTATLRVFWLHTSNAVLRRPTAAKQHTHMSHRVDKQQRNPTEFQLGSALGFFD